MKKRLALIGAVIFLLFAAGCGTNGNATPDNHEENVTAPESDSVEQSPDSAEASGDTESGVSQETPDDAAKNSPVDNAVENPLVDAPEETPEADAPKILVAYFSATGTTKGVAENLAAALNADIYEITPEEPYTAEDLDYNDRTTRATVEQNTPDVRPAIAGGVDNMEQYDTVFIGYPIWWGDAPRIVSTFAESYDFTGKTAVSFCTSGGSGIATSERTLREQADGAQWLSGRRFSGGASVEELREWAAGLGVAPQE